MQEQNVANIPLAKTQGDAKNTSRTSGQKHRNIREAMEMAMHAIFLLCGVVAVGFVLLISIYLIVSGIPAIREVGLVDFLFGQRWAPTNKQDPAYGILPFILTSIYGTAGAVVVGVPIGLMTAIFLSKCASPKVAGIIHTAVELLAGIPSVVYGLVGMIVLVPAIREMFDLSSGASLLAAIIVLAIMILPSIINVSENALNAVPKEYEEASLALGATKIETIFKVSLPAARSGVATAVVWVLDVQSVKQWQSSWYPVTFQICRDCLPRFVSSPLQSHPKCPMQHLALCRDRHFSPLVWYCSYLSC